MSVVSTVENFEISKVLEDERVTGEGVFGQGRRGSIDFSREGNEISITVCSLSFVA